MANRSNETSAIIYPDKQVGSSKSDYRAKRWPIGAVDRLSTSETTSLSAIFEIKRGIISRDKSF